MKISETKATPLVADSILLSLKDRFSYTPLDLSMDPRLLVQMSREEGSRDFEWAVIAGALIQMYETSTSRHFTGASRHYEQEEFEHTYRRKTPENSSSATALAKQLLAVEFPKYLIREPAERAHSCFMVHYKSVKHVDETCGIIVYGRVPPMMLSVLSDNLRYPR